MPAQHHAPDGQNCPCDNCRRIDRLERAVLLLLNTARNGDDYEFPDTELRDMLAEFRGLTPAPPAP